VLELLLDRFYCLYAARKTMEFMHRKLSVELSSSSLEGKRSLSAENGNGSNLYCQALVLLSLDLNN
jgi:hypothetical protein